MPRVVHLVVSSFESNRSSAPDGSGQHVPMLIASVPPRSQVVFTVYLRVLPTPPSAHTLNVPMPSLMNVLVVPSNDFSTVKVVSFWMSTVPVPFKIRPPVHDAPLAFGSSTSLPPSAKFRLDWRK